MSIIYVRGTGGIHMVNTQTWAITTLVHLSEGGAKFPDLALLTVEAGLDHRLVVYTCDKADHVLVKRSFSHMLKFCIQTACIRATESKPEALRKKLLD